MIGGILFFSCLLVCQSICLLSPLTFAITWTVGGRGFIFGMQWCLLNWWCPRSMTLWLWPMCKKYLFGLCCRRGHNISQTRIFFLLYFYIRSATEILDLNTDWRWRYPNQAICRDIMGHTPHSDLGRGSNCMQIDILSKYSHWIWKMDEASPHLYLYRRGIRWGKECISKAYCVTV